MSAINPDEPRDWYFTFGFGQVDPSTGASLANHYVVLHGTYEGSRQRMYSLYGRQWAFQYADALAAGVECFRLWEVSA